MGWHRPLVPNLSVVGKPQMFGVPAKELQIDLHIKNMVEWINTILHLHTTLFPPNARAVYFDLIKHKFFKSIVNLVVTFIHDVFFKLINKTVANMYTSVGSECLPVKCKV